MDKSQKNRMKSLVELQELIQRVNKNHKPLHEEPFRKIQQTIEPTRKRLKNLVDANKPVRQNAQMKEIIQANKHSLNLIKNQTKLPTPHNINIHPSWLQLSPTISADLPNYSKKIIQNNSLWLDAIKNLQASINLEALEKQYEISQPVLSDM